MRLRPYVETDASVTLEIFLRAIRETAHRDYSPEQIAAWAHDRDPVEWNSARQESNTEIAEIGGRIAGFTDVSLDGYIDMLFVHPDYGRRGVGTALVTWASETARKSGATQLSTHASITARPFFETLGFVVEAERMPIVMGVGMINYRMTRSLDEVGVDAQDEAP